MALKSTHIVFVHDFFGWGPQELGLPYWGDALDQIGEPFMVHEAKVGPVSSFHDRACELFAQIGGGRVDYGERHSNEARHARYSREYMNPFAPDWSDKNPVILVGHGAGAQTAMQLQALLADDFWKRGSSADWIEGVVSVAGAINGSLLPYGFGCDHADGRFRRRPSRLIAESFKFLGMAAGVPSAMRKPFDLHLDHWTEGESDSYEAMARLDAGAFVEGHDNLAFDLTLQGCRNANARFRSHPDSFYLALVTNATHARPSGFFRKTWRPDSTIHPVLWQPALYQAREANFAKAPIVGWGGGDLSLPQWRPNDGAVSVISQRYPFTARQEPVGGEGVFERHRLKPGRWYYEYLDKAIGHRFDHFDAVVGAQLKPWVPGLRDAHREIYLRLGETLRGL
ncbi:MAG: hypothetical protein FJX45_07180 [Alphaproteobacteria bacterium]|nr:hypothetical protein [Alphaproteobacteria bacterium]